MEIQWLFLILVIAVFVFAPTKRCRWTLGRSGESTAAMPGTFSGFIDTSDNASAIACAAGSIRRQ